MIKLFRNIRKTLIEEGKTTNYLKYAIGEIVLVVIGILIALQINNWNEQRKINREEQQALVNIKQDFSDNKEVLLEVMKTSEECINSCLYVLNFTGDKTKPKREQSIDSLLNSITNTPYYYPRNGFLDDLINSGKLSVFKNVELRNLLSSWKPMVDKVQDKFTSAINYQSSLNDYILKNGSWLNADAVMTKKRNIQFPESGFEIDNRQMLMDIEFENMIENLAITIDNYRERQDEALDLINKILELIDKELNSKP